MKTIFIYLTNPNKKTAEQIVEVLINKKLIICANIFPVESLYYYENKLIKDKEFVLILKTFDEKYKEIEKEIKKIHPYKIPLIAKINIIINNDYLNWMKGQIR